jgi:hypothetical protein
MSAGKYSPTISASYRFDQKWWDRNGGGYGNGKNPESDMDDDGYDSYGYSKNGSGPDRAGKYEEDYERGEWMDDEYCYPLYEDISSEWSSTLLGDLPFYQKVAYERLRLEYIKFADTRYIFRGETMYIHADDLEEFISKNAKYLKSR